MSQQLIPQDNQTLIPKELTEQDLPPLVNLRQQNFLVYLISGYSLTNAYINAGYESELHAGKSAWQLANTSPIKDHLDWHRKQIANSINPEWILSRYAKLIDDSMNEDKPHLYDPEIAIKAMQELTKIKGMYAPTNFNVQTVSASIDDIRNAMLEYKRDK